MQTRRLYPLLVAVVGALLFLPALGSSGFWDPSEVRLADAARAVAERGVSAGPQLGRPPLLVWSIAAGFRSLGVSELGGRLPIALLALLALLATYYAGSTLIRPRAALIGTLALATCPTFLLGARQLSSSAPMLLAAALAIGGLARAAWPGREMARVERLGHLALGLLGLGLGQLGAGTFVGVVLPVGALALALTLGGGALGPTVVAGFAALAGLVLVAWSFGVARRYSPLVGGIPHPLSNQTVVTAQLKQLGFGLFPWIVVAPFGAVRALVGLDDGEPAARNQEGGPPLATERDRFGVLLLLGWAVLALIVGTLEAAGVAELISPAAAPLLLLTGYYLDELLASPQAARPIAGLAIALAAIAVGRDLFLGPEYFVGAHLLEPIHWPSVLNRPPYLLLAFASLWGSLVALGVGAPLELLERGERGRGQGRRLLLVSAVVASLLMALGTVHYVVPQVSRHFSARDLYGRTQRLDPTAELGQYHFNAAGASYYAGGRTPHPLGTVNDLFAFLARPKRVFVLASAEELAAVDQAARTSKANYYVIDDSNSRFLVLSNQLGPSEQDVNPLRRLVSATPPRPQYEVHADFEGKIELLGYDLPTELYHGRDFKIRLYFKVNQPAGGIYKVFLHFMGSSYINGDHVPLDGRFPTPYWVPGYYITDEHTVAPKTGDQLTAPSGVYQIYMGFFAGDRRMKVVSGPQDGDNRVKLGLLRLK